MKTIEPKQLFSRYGMPLGRYENTIADDETGTIEPTGCCGDPRVRCSHASPEVAHQSMLHYKAGQAYRIPPREWIPTPLPCSHPECSEFGQHQVIYDGQSVTLCVSHCNDEAMREFVLEYEQKRAGNSTARSVQ